MRLKPFDSAPSTLETDSNPINEALTLAGVVKKKGATDADKIKEIFDEAGASPEDIARTVGYLLKNSESEITQLRAAEFAARVQGFLSDLEKDQKAAPEVNINIIGTGNQTLVQLLMPSE